MINVQQLLHVLEGLCCLVQINRTKLISLEMHQAVLDNQQMSGCAMDA